MQKPVKKNLEKKSNDNSLKKFKKKFSKHAASKFSKFGKKWNLFKSILKKNFKNFLFRRKIGRVFRRFKAFSNKNFLRIDIRVAQNNIFCSLNQISPNKTVIPKNAVIPKHILRSLKRNVHNQVLLKASAGVYKVDISKKILRSQSSIVLESFLTSIREQQIAINKPIYIKIIAPVLIKRFILKNISRFFLKKLKKRKTIIVYVDPKKVFNGCKARKKTKKKRKSFIIYK